MSALVTFEMINEDGTIVKSTQSPWMTRSVRIEDVSRDSSKLIRERYCKKGATYWTKDLKAVKFFGHIYPGSPDAEFAYGTVECKSR
jgi:hypothetical protein